MLEEFKKFALRGNVIDLAVGIIIGGAFNNIVQSLVKDIIMPPIGLLIGNLDFSNLMLVLKPPSDPAALASPDALQAAGGVSLNYGLFLNNVISFLIVAFSVFLLVRAINRLYVHKEDETAEAKPVVKECPYCKKEVAVEATRCAYCTSELGSTV